jgi:hypothetical protein
VTVYFPLERYGQVRRTSFISSSHCYPFDQQKQLWGDQKRIFEQATTQSENGEYLNTRKRTCELFDRPRAMPARDQEFNIFVKIKIQDGNFKAFITNTREKQKYESLMHGQLQQMSRLHIVQKIIHSAIHSVVGDTSPCFSLFLPHPSGFVMTTPTINTEPK